jgi:UDPglucose--hexose-1-phosphate uridylyltransferase
LVDVWKDRYVDLSMRPGIEYVYIFENKGHEIGVTLTHPHGQIYGYPFIPKVIRIRHEAEEEYFQEHGRTLQQAWLAAELAQSKRVVWRSEYWTALVPFFARLPYEVHILPNRPVCHIGQLSATERHELARALRSIASKYDRLFGFSMPYVMSIFQSRIPNTGFEVEFAPPYRTKDRLKYLAGSESGCGIFINDTLPEETAAQLRAL